MSKLKGSNIAICSSNSINQFSQDNLSFAIIMVCVILRKIRMTFISEQVDFSPNLSEFYLRAHHLLLFVCVDFSPLCIFCIYFVSFSSSPGEFYLREGLFFSVLLFCVILRQIRVNFI